MAFYKDTQYKTDKDREILNRIEFFAEENMSHNQYGWAEADRDYRFYIDDQNAWAQQYSHVPHARRPKFGFNHIRRTINMVSGYQRQHRKSTIVTPVEYATQETADDFTQAFMHIDRSAGVSNCISEAFEGALITGMNLLQLWVDYRNDPISGDIKIDKCAYNEFMIDPYFRKPDLSDCRGILKRSYLSRQEILSLMPEHEDIIMSLSAQTGSPDGKFNYMPEAYGFNNSNLLTYDEFYYRDFRNQKLLVDTITGETMEWTSDDKETLDSFLAHYPQIEVFNQEIPTVKLAIVAQGEVLYDDVQPSGLDEYPFVPVFAYFNPDVPYLPDRVQGMVRGLRDAQFLYNRRMCINLDVLESQVNSGWIYKENALINPKDVFMSGQGRGIALKDDAQVTDVQRIDPPQIPPSMLEMSQMLSKEIQEISGVNEELLGSAEEDTAGILSMLRQGAGLTTLQSLFDQLDFAQKHLGRLMISLIQKNYTPAKMERILGQEPSEEFYNKNFGKYDSAVEEGFNTTTQRQMEFAQLVKLREAGVPVPDEALIQSATVQNKTKLIEMITQNQQQAQEMEQAKAESQISESRARAELVRAQAQADIGLAQERMSNIEKNRAQAIENVEKSYETRMDAQDAHEDALLKRVKAVKEIEEMDLNKIQRLLDMLEMVKRQSEITYDTDPMDPPLSKVVEREQVLRQQNEAAEQTQQEVEQAVPDSLPTDEQMGRPAPSPLSTDDDGQDITGV